MAELFFGDFRFDTRKLVLAGPDGPLDLRAKTREVLLYLIEHRNRFVSRDELLRKVWAGVTVSGASVTQCISELRQILGDSARDAAYVETILLQERRRRELPSPTPLRPKRQELIEEIELDDPDPAIYDRFSDNQQSEQEDHGQA